MQSLIVALALTASNALVAKTLPAARPRAARASVKMELIMPEKDFLIAPSILSADFAKLGAEVDASLAAGADVVHFDVMDNHYVPNLTIGPMVCSALRKHGVTAPIDVHLMVSPVDRIVQDFADAGASYITFHPEASPHAWCGVRRSTSRRWRGGRRDEKDVMIFTRAGGRGADREPRPPHAHQGRPHHRRQTALPGGLGGAEALVAHRTHEARGLELNGADGPPKPPPQPPRITVSVYATFVFSPGA